MTSLPEGVQWIPVSLHADARGELAAFDRSNLPFEPVRIFVITDVPNGATRGGHVISCDEFFWIRLGRCRLSICTGGFRTSLLLDDPKRGVVVPAGSFLELTDFAPDTILTVMAPQPYAPGSPRRPPRLPPRRNQPLPAADPSRRFAGQRTDIDLAIARVFESGTFILGPECAAFEDEFADYLGVRHAVGVGSGTQALSFALAALGVGAGDEVITVSLTFAATALAIEATGAKPIFVDVDRGSRCIDVAALEAAITPSTAAVIPVHLHGFPAAMPEIMKIATRHGLAVVEDCAQSHGAALGPRRTGSFGQAAAFSFYPTKNLGAAGDGGAVVTNDPSVAERVRRLRNYGMDADRICVGPGINGRLDEVQAAILRVLLPRLDEDNATRRVLAGQYRSKLKDAMLELPPHCDGAVYHQFAVALDQRDAVRRCLIETHGVESAIHYARPVHQHPHFFRTDLSLPVTEQFAARLLSLPIQGEIAAGRVDYIANALVESIAACRS
ncbi:aminotransferase class I/II-fold pyridoxal phosphate-dependent enzyme [uncultured Bradyrhizobium sp.]|uniref:aminotransferase class I/II-fold pyridoxal phosphate-dependent enzyme n=1 Tax=uncultured Bradyrhizobium sp. TaxID=199684 RepID=UPI0035CA82BD